MLEREFYCPIHKRKSVVMTSYGENSGHLSCCCDVVEHDYAGEKVILCHEYFSGKIGVIKFDYRFPNHRIENGQAGASELLHHLHASREVKSNISQMLHARGVSGLVELIDLIAPCWNERTIAQVRMRLITLGLLYLRADAGTQFLLSDMANSREFVFHLTRDTRFALGENS